MRLPTSSVVLASSLSLSLAFLSNPAIASAEIALDPSSPTESPPSSPVLEQSGFSPPLPDFDADPPSTHQVKMRNQTVVGPKKERRDHRSAETGPHRSGGGGGGHQRSMSHGRSNRHGRPFDGGRNGRGRDDASRGDHDGEGTYFSPDVGACGNPNSADDMIVAVSHLLYDSYPGATPNPNDNPICGRRIRANYQGRSVVVEVQDRCEACAKWDLDFSPRAFNRLADPDVGRIYGMEWEFI